MGDGGFSSDEGELDRYVLSFVDATRPKVCFLPTASSAVPVYVLRFLEAFPARSFEPTYLDLFERRVGDVVSFLDRKSTRLNSSHANISYAVFCLKKKIKSMRLDAHTY